MFECVFIKLYSFKHFKTMKIVLKHFSRFLIFYNPKYNQTFFCFFFHFFLPLCYFLRSQNSSILATNLSSERNFNYAGLDPQDLILKMSINCCLLDLILIYLKNKISVLMYFTLICNKILGCTLVSSGNMGVLGQYELVLFVPL
jgi:hypothetical protein